MKAKWIIAGAGVLVIAGAMPWVTGYVTEQQWQQVTRQLNQSQSLVQMQTVEYDRSFFGSELNGVITLINPGSGDPHAVEYQAQVSHGITGSLMDFVPASGWEPDGADWFDEQPGLTLETRLWGTAVLELQAPAMVIHNPQSDETVTASGGVARVEVGDAGASAQILGVWPQLEFSGPDSRLKINDLRFEQDMARLSDEVWTGIMDASVDSIALTSAGTPPVTLNNVQVASRTDAVDDDKRLDSELSVEAGQIRFADQAYGPHKLVFSLEDLEVASWSRLTTRMAELQELALTTEAGSREAFERQVAAMEKVNAAMRNLAGAGFSAGFPELTLNTPEGAVHGDLVIRHPQLDADQQAEMLLVMQQLTGELNLSLPLALAENYPFVRMQLAPLVKQGLLVQEGDALVLAATLNDMLVQVNGQEIPLPPLF